MSSSDHIARRHRGLVGRTALVSGLTLLSRILGFVREMISAALFGDGSAVWDAFLTAWRVPNLFRRLFGEGALSTSLQTALTEEDADRGDGAGRALFLGTLRWMTAILLGVTVLAMAVAWVLPDRMPGTGWAWLGADPAPVRDLTVRLLPFVLLVCLAALCGGALQVRGHFAVPNLAPALMNLVWIAALVGIGWHFGASGGETPSDALQWTMARWLAWGVLLGGLLQLALHVPPLLKRGLLGPLGGSAGTAPPRRTPGDVLRTALPLALGAAVYQINVMIDGLMAEGLLRDGGPTALYYANRVQQFPLALIAIAATNAVFPSLKALGHLGRREELRRLHDRSQLGVLFLALPAAAGLWGLAEPIAAVLFQRGHYGPEGVARLAATLRMLALALVPAGAVGLCGRVYYAMADFRTPVRVSVAMLVLNVGLNALLVAGLGMDADGLALATALTSWGNLVLLLPGLRTRLGLPGGDFAPGRVLRTLAAALASGVLAVAAQRGTALLLGLEGDAATRSALALAAAAVAGAGSYFAFAALLRSPELGELRARLRRG